MRVGLTSLLLMVVVLLVCTGAGKADTTKTCPASFIEAYSECLQKGFASKIENCVPAHDAKGPNAKHNKECLKLEKKLRRLCKYECPKDRALPHTEAPNPGAEQVPDTWGLGPSNRGFRAAGFEACASACRDAEDCKSVTFRRNDGWCWLKGTDLNNDVVSKNMKTISFYHWIIGVIVD